MAGNHVPYQVAGTSAGSRKWKWIGIVVAVLVVVLVVGGNVLLHHAGPILKGRIEETLSTRFNSRVELGDLNVWILRGLEVSGDRLEIYPPDDVVAAGATKPLIAVQHFQFHTGFLGLLIKPTHVRTVEMSGLDINIPPRNQRQQSSGKSQHKGKIKIDVEQLLCENSRLVIGASNPAKDPKDFELKHIAMHNVGPNQPWTFDAYLTNAVPRGEIHATGRFGPWETESPGDSGVRGHYTFDNADLDTIKGIGGTLSSIGDFEGRLDKISVHGTTDTPNFSLDTANHPLPLSTQFQAIVDGTTGDTYLQQVKAKLRNADFTTSGTVINVKGQGHRTELNVDIPSAPIQDFLDLAVKTQPTVMTGLISTKLKLQILPGKESVTKKLGFDGGFSLRQIRFTNPKVQDKVDMLSLRAQGQPKEAKPGAPDVNSKMTGQFAMANGAISFQELSYVMPGAQVHLNGIYSLDGAKFDFHGRVLTDASLSQMVASPVGSVLLKVISPFFKKKGGGTEIPVSISGTKSEPKFGLDVMKHH